MGGAGSSLELDVRRGRGEVGLVGPCETAAVRAGSALVVRQITRLVHLRNVGDRSFVSLSILHLFVTQRRLRSRIKCLNSSLVVLGCIEVRRRHQQLMRLVHETVVLLHAESIETLGRGAHNAAGVVIVAHGLGEGVRLLLFGQVRAAALQLHLSHHLLLVVGGDHLGLCVDHLLRGESVRHVQLVLVLLVVRLVANYQHSLLVVLLGAAPLALSGSAGGARVTPASTRRRSRSRGDQPVVGRSLQERGLVLGRCALLLGLRLVVQLGRDSLVG